MNANKINLKTLRVRAPCTARQVIVKDTNSLKEASCGRDKAKKKLCSNSADLKVLSTFRSNARKDLVFLYIDFNPHNCRLG